MLKSENSDKIYECETCGKTFNRRTYLQLHEKIHGEKCYKCDICDKSFRQPAGLWIHKKNQSCMKRNSPGNKHTSSCNGQFDEGTDDNGKRHKCDICNRRFSQKHLLTYHKRTHTGENPYPCTICGKMFRGTATLKYHERTHTGHKPYKCIFCVKAFTQLGPLKLHSKKEHQSEKIYECDVCKEQFEKFRELSSHRKAHSEILNQGKSPCQAVQHEIPSNQVKRDRCTRYDKLKVTRYETRSHSPVSLVSESDEEGKGMSVNENNSNPDSLFFAKKRKRNGSQSSDKSKKTTYEICPKTPIKDCIITSHPEGESSCMSVTDEISASMICGNFKTIADFGPSPEDQVLTRPVKEEHEIPCLSGKKYTCNVCGQEFSQAHVLKHHKRTHTGESPHPCTVCSKTFRTPGALTVHQRTHNGQKPYKCIFCSQGFSQRGALLQHCRRIHFSDQIYECDVCKEKFEKYRDLSSHSHVHSDTPCTMVKEIYDRVEEEDERVIRLDFLPPISPLNVSVGDCDSNKENNNLASAKLSSDVPYDVHKKHFTNWPNGAYEQAGNECLSVIQEKENFDSYTENNSQVSDVPSRQDDEEKHCTNPPYRAYKEIGNVNISFSDERCLVRVKQEYEDCDSSNDSGISPDTSPSDLHVDCEERESDLIYEVSMQPIKVHSEGKDLLRERSVTGDRPSLHESQNFPADVVGQCSKTISDDDESSNYSRVTTPDNDHIFSCCSDDFQQNSLFEKKSAASISCRFLHGNHTIFTAKPPDVNNQKWKEDNPINTSNYSLVKNSSCPSTSLYNSAKFQPSSTEMDLIQEFSDCANNIPDHSEVFNNDDKILYSDMKFDSNVCESQISYLRELLHNQENFTNNTFPCFQNSITKISNDDNKMHPIPSEDEQKHWCVGCGEKAGIAPENLQQNPKYEYGKTLTNGTQYICFKCDVLPASCHLGRQ